MNARRLWYLYAKSCNKYLKKNQPPIPYICTKPNRLSQIPEIAFSPSHADIEGFEIIDLEKIKANKESYDDDPEQAHQPNFFILLFYTQGSSEHHIDFKSYPVETNTLVYIARKQVNAFSFTPDLNGYCLVFSQEFFETCFSQLGKEIIFRLFTPQLFEPTLNVPQDSDLIQYIKLLYKEYYAERSFNKRAIIESLFTIILTKAEQLKKTETSNLADNAKTRTFSKFTQLIEANYTQNRNADFYADALAITYKHLNTICKELVQKTAKTYIDDFVILEAKRQLINSDIGSTKLAYSLGFDEPTNFIKFFKKRTNITPKQFLSSVNK